MQKMDKRRRRAFEEIEGRRWTEMGRKYLFEMCSKATREITSRHFPGFTAKYLSSRYGARLRGLGETFTREEATLLPFKPHC